MSYVVFYLVVAVVVSLFVPLRIGRTIDTLRDVSPMTKVLASLLWPLLCVVWLAARVLP